jgi:hypothetical protein
MRWILALVAVLALASCGGRSGGGGGSVRSATGEISRACLAANRSAASPQLCGCVQGVANQTLGSSDQRRAADFFADPQEAQDTRQSDRNSDEAFWARYKNFTTTAEALCAPAA